MTSDPKAEFFTYSPMDIAALEERAAIELYRAKKTRFKYRRDLQQMLKDHTTDVLARQLQEPKPVPKLQRPPSRQAVVVGLCAAPFFVAGVLAVFFLTLWVITGGPFR